MSGYRLHGVGCGMEGLVTMIDNISLDRIGTDDAYNRTSLYEQHMDTEESADNDSPFQFGNGKCDYYEAKQFFS